MPEAQKLEPGLGQVVIGGWWSWLARMTFCHTWTTWGKCMIYLRIGVGGGVGIGSGTGQQKKKEK